MRSTRQPCVKEPRAAGAAMAGLAAALVCACAPGGAAGTVATGPGAEFDAQGCAEDAMRRSPDPEVMPDAAVGFSRWCALGDAPACSMLGVMHELGLGVRRSRERARSLYRRACDGGNARACGNLDELLRGTTGASPPPLGRGG
jgi:TPR repeat protein